MAIFSHAFRDDEFQKVRIAAQIVRNGRAIYQAAVCRISPV